MVEDREYATSPYLKSKNKLSVKKCDMEEGMQHLAVELCEEALNRFTADIDIARYIKEGFDKKYAPPWHCIVGQKFGSYVTYESGYFIYFKINNMAVMLFRAKD